MISNRDTKVEVAAQISPFLGEWGGVAGVSAPSTYGDVRSKLNAVAAYNGLPTIRAGEIGGDARAKINALLHIQNYRKLDLDFIANKGLVIGPNSRAGGITELLTVGGGMTSISLSDFPWSSGAGVLVVKAVAASGAAFLPLGNIGGVGDVNASPTLRFAAYPGHLNFYAHLPPYGDASVNLPATIDIHTPFTAAFGWSGNIVKMCVNGGAASTNVMPATTERNDFAKLIFGQGAWFGAAEVPLMSALYMPHLPSDADFQTLTT